MHTEITMEVVYEDSEIDSFAVWNPTIGVDNTFHQSNHKAAPLHNYEVLTQEYSYRNQIE